MYLYKVKVYAFGMTVFYLPIKNYSVNFKHYAAHENRIFRIYNRITASGSGPKNIKCLEYILS